MVDLVVVEEDGVEGEVKEPSGSRVDTSLKEPEVGGWAVAVV